MSQSLSNNVTVRITDQAGTAIGRFINLSTINILMMTVLSAGKDYSSGPRNVTFTKGSKRASLPFHDYPINDEIVEKDEFFNISIDPSSLPDGVFLGDPCQATVTIRDNDSK